MHRILLNHDNAYNYDHIIRTSEVVHSKNNGMLFTDAWLLAIFEGFIFAESLDNFGVLLLWDCSMPHMKNSFDEITKEQAPYR